MKQRGFLSSKRLLGNVLEATAAKPEQARKQGLYRINVYFEPVSNEAMATKIVFRRSAGIWRDSTQLNRIVSLEIPATASKPNQVAEATATAAAQNAVKKNSEFNNKNDVYIQKKSKWIQVLSAFLFKLLCFVLLFIAE